MKTQNLEEFLAAVERGDRQAAEEMVRRYEPYLRRVIRLRLRGHRVRYLFDSMDICQSILAEFFRRAGTGGCKLGSTRQLRVLLVKMALNKIRDKARRERRHAGHLPEGWEPFSPEDTPGQQASKRELLEAVCERLAECERQLFDLRRQG